MSRAQLTSTVEQNTGGAVAPFVAGKNAVINGGMEIWQRGTSFGTTGTFSTSYTADRWQGYQGGAGTSQTTSCQASDLTGFRYFARVQRNSGSTATGYIGLWQTIETAVSIPYAGQTVTLSWYARAGSGMTNANSLSAWVYSGTGTDEPWYSATGSTSPASGVVTLLSTGGIVNGWKRFSITGTLPSNATELGVVFEYFPTGTAGANDYYDITGVQLELGSVPTAFSRAGGTLQGELAACQRYFVRFNPTFISDAPFGTGIFKTTTAAAHIMNLPVTMRSAPSTTFSAANTFYCWGGAGSGSPSAVTGGGNTTNIIELSATRSSTTAGFASYIQALGAAAAYVDASAEL